MKVWPLAIRTVGAFSVMLSLWGTYFQVFALQREIRHPAFIPQAPYFRAVFFTMTALDIIFLAAMACIGVSLIRLQRRAALIYSIFVVALVAFVFVPSAAWPIRDSLGRSIAAAGGIGNVGLGPFLFFPVAFVYPLVSVVTVNLAQYKIEKSRENVDKPF